VRPARWGSGFLRSGTAPGAAPTVCFAAPPLAVFGCAKRSLRSHARINPSTQPSDVARGSRSRAGELTLGLLSGEEHSVVGFGFVVDSPLTPALSRGRGSRFLGLSKSEFNAVSHVGVPLPNHSVSPLSLWERARVRGSCFNASKPEFSSVFHVGVPLPNHSVSPLSLWERARVRGSCFKASKSESNSVFHVGVPLPNHSVSPLSLRERARVRGSCFNASKPEFSSVFHVGVPHPNTSVSSLSLRERARVRAAI
jgi:hypothetical protein